VKIKINREKFQRVLDQELYTLSSLAREIGTSQSYLSRIQSDNINYTMSKTMARRIMEVLDSKYRFDELFLTIDSKDFASV
jgi:predicted transcriptional regulator